MRPNMKRKKSCR